MSAGGRTNTIKSVDFLEIYHVDLTARGLDALLRASNKNKQLYLYNAACVAGGFVWISAFTHASAIVTFLFRFPASHARSSCHANWRYILRSDTGCQNVMKRAAVEKAANPGRRSLLRRGSFSGETARKRGKKRDNGEIKKLGVPRALSFPFSPAPARFISPLPIPQRPLRR